MPTEVQARDVIEYACVRNMAYALHQLSRRVSEILPLNGNTGLEDMRQLVYETLNDIIARLTKENIPFTNNQQETLRLAVESLVQDITDFDAQIRTLTEEELRAQLGTVSKVLKPDEFSIDKHSYPGVVVVKPDSEAAYAKIDTRKQRTVSRGLFGGGEGLLENRIIRLNPKVDNPKNTLRHEYHHFLFHKLQKRLSMLPEVSPRHTRDRIEQIDSIVNDRLQSIEDQLLDIELDMDEYSDLTELQNQRITLQQQKDNVIAFDLQQKFSIASEYSTYQEEEVIDVFQKFKNEFLAYGYGDNREVSLNSLIPGERLSKAKELPIYPLFATHIKIAWAEIKRAYRLGFTTQDLAMLVAGSRSFIQMAKFVRLHTIDAEQ